MRIAALVIPLVMAGCIAGQKVADQQASPAPPTEQALLRQFVETHDPIERIRIAGRLSEIARRSGGELSEGIARQMLRHAADRDPKIAVPARTFFYESDEYSNKPPTFASLAANDEERLCAIMGAKYKPELVEALFRLKDRTTPLEARLEIATAKNLYELTPAFLPALLALARSSDEPDELRAAILRGTTYELFQFDSSALSLANDKSPLIRRTFAESGSLYDPRVKSLVIRLQKDPDQRVSAAARAAIAKHDYDHTIDRDDPPVRDGSIFSARLGGIQLYQARDSVYWDRDKRLFLRATSECDGGSVSLFLTDTFELFNDGYPAGRYLVEWKIDTSPTDRGISLGMKREQVRSVFGRPNKREEIELNGTWMDAETYETVYPSADDPEWEVSFSATYYYRDNVLCGIMLSRNSC